MDTLSEAGRPIDERLVTSGKKHTLKLLYSSGKTALCKNSKYDISVAYSKVKIEGYAASLDVTHRIVDFGCQEIPFDKIKAAYSQVTGNTGVSYKCIVNNLGHPIAQYLEESENFYIGTSMPNSISSSRNILITKSKHKVKDVIIETGPLKPYCGGYNYGVAQYTIISGNSVKKHTARLKYLNDLVIEIDKIIDSINMKSKQYV